MWMGMWPDTAIYIPWDVWAVTWIAAALWANRTIKRPDLGSELTYRIVTLAGFALLLGAALKVHDGHYSLVPLTGLLGTRYWMVPVAVGWTMVGLATLGFVFAWWARIYLGRLWSGRITRKEGHHVVDTGPYAIVRHPIYTGIYVAAIATTVAMGSLHAILGTLLLIVGYWMKASLEERFLSQELGPQNYAAYRRRVPMLIPFGPKGA
jgi:protein-S-isoprenylcysteine O-methyltransferase Ste14